MTSSTPEMVISGVPYTVLEVEGRVPGDLEDFVGERQFVLDGPTGRHVVSGDGFVDDDDGAVRFHQKAPDGGKDVRVWRVSPTPEGTFVAAAT
ncbi:hypothetical protein [Cellulomonas sp. KRMCY2]|uniref:hypothetical protein n=1 Tax=Cellulomonas sp. KRMCY2 TaxID=1304865 RepID=UPI00045E9D3A|nr:hypothetical protein [Cellulomonas sp. KRMCY2]